MAMWGIYIFMILQKVDLMSMQTVIWFLSNEQTKLNPWFVFERNNDYYQLYISRARTIGYDS